MRQHYRYRQTAIYALLLTFAAFLDGCSTVAPNAGEEAVLVAKPWFFGHGGVDQTPVTTGRVFIALTTDSIIVNVQPQTYHLKIDDMMSKDGVPLDFASSIRLKITNSPRMVQQFGEHWYQNNVEQQFFQSIRDAVKKRGMNEVAIETSASDAIDAEVTEVMKAYLVAKGIPATLEDVNVGKANPPDSVKTQRTETATQEQRQNTEKQAKLAEDQRAMHEASRAKADNSYREAMNLSPSQFLELKSIEAMREVCGSGKCSIVTTGALPTFGIKAHTQ